MKYAIYLNNQFVDSYTDYERACEILDNLIQRFKKAVVEIRPEY